MSDKLSKKERSWNMSRIKSGNTKPELIVRSLLHRLGYRFRLHGKVAKKYYSKGILPGKPDIILAKYNTVIFVHGCFWHRHENCKFAYDPKSRISFWNNKFTENTKRDKLVTQQLKEMGWKVMIIWECETKKIDKLRYKICQELNLD